MSEEQKKPQTGQPTPGAGTSGAGTDEAQATAENVAALKADLERAKEEAQQNWERYLREAAELQNLRKRSAEREEKARKFAIDRFAGDVLNVKDSLEMGLAAAGGEASLEALREGMQATLRQFEQALQNAGMREVDPAGEAFDPSQHEAMAIQEVPGLEREEVVTVVQKGYLLHERVLRPARVIVGKPAAAGGAGGDGPSTGTTQG